MLGLTDRTVPHLAAPDLGESDQGATSVTGQISPVIDVHSLLPGKAYPGAHSDVAGLHGENVAEFDSPAQLDNRQLPQCQRGIFGELIGGRRRIDARQEQQFGPIYVADACDHRLIEQGGSDGHLLGNESLDELMSPTGHRDGVRSEVIPDRLFLVGSDYVTDHRAGQEHGCRIGAKNQPRVGSGRRSGATMNLELADQAKMDVEPLIALPVIEKVFAVSFHPLEGPAVEKGGSFAESTLRRRDPDRLAQPESGGLQAHVAMGYVTFGHEGPLYCGGGLPGHRGRDGPMVGPFHMGDRRLDDSQTR